MLMGAGLAGCSAADTAPPATPSSSTVTTDAAAPAAPPVVDGTVLTEEPTNLTATQSLYELYDDGGNFTGYVVIDSTLPLPETVKAHIAAPVSALTTELGASSGSGTFVIEAEAKRQAAKAEKYTGKRVLIVFKQWGSLDAVNETYVYVALGNQGAGPGGDSASYSYEETFAKTQAWVAAQPDAAKWEIVSATP